jgi:sigma-B regulation protein RsbU (phosphoserine phosphatase)
LYRAATDEFEFLDTEGMPIGIMSGVEYGQSYTILEKGDIAILYTDGISEAMNMAHEEFGLDKFKEVIRVNKKEGAKELCNRVLEAVTNFAGAAPQHDDETLLVLKSK